MAPIIVGFLRCASLILSSLYKSALRFRHFGGCIMPPPLLGCGWSFARWLVGSPMVTNRIDSCWIGRRICAHGHWMWPVVSRATEQQGAFALLSLRHHVPCALCVPLANITSTHTTRELSQRWAGWQTQLAAAITEIIGHTLSLRFAGREREGWDAGERGCCPLI